MIVVDTNIISEVMRPRPDARVVSWLNSQPAADLYVSGVTIAEIGLGLRAMPAGRRQILLESRFDVLVAQGFENRVLDFTEAAARAYAKIMAHRQKMGRPMGVADGQIAATASVHRARVATRDVSDFEACGLTLINPFEDAD